MPLHATLESLEGLPEEFHDDYEERDGKFHLKLLDGYIDKEQIGDAEIVTGLKSALAKERDNVKSVTGKLKTLEATVDGVDLERRNGAKQLA